MPETLLGDLNPPSRVLLGAGPSNVNPRVLRAMINPLLGYLDPDFIRIMDDVSGMLQQVFGATGGFTLPVSGTGSAGMEAGLANVLEPGDVAVVVSHGYFGERLAEIARRHGATVAVVPGEWGKTISLEAVEAELAQHSRVKVLATVHAETSTGVLQPLEDLARLAHQRDALFLVDAVTSLGGTKVEVDSTGIDVCYSATQKCIGAPPGLSPVHINKRALDAIEQRTEPPRSWYLDLGLLRKYWEGGTRVYHHTAPMTMVYALREALRLVLEEGLEKRYERHRLNGRALRAGLEAMGLKLLVPEAQCTYQLTSLLIPEGVDDGAMRTRLLHEYNIEIGGGLGRFQGSAWRIGLMGESSTASNVLFVLSAMENLLPQLGFEVAVGSGVSEASRVFAGVD